MTVLFNNIKRRIQCGALLLAFVLMGSIVPREAYAADACENLLLTPPGMTALEQIIKGRLVSSNNAIENWMIVLKAFTADSRHVDDQLIERFLALEKQQVSLNHLRVMDSKVRNVFDDLSFDEPDDKLRDFYFAHSQEAFKRLRSLDSWKHLEDFEKLESILYGNAVLRMINQRQNFRLRKEQVRPALDVLFDPQSLVIDFGIDFQPDSLDISNKKPLAKNSEVTLFVKNLFPSLLRVRAPFLQNRNLDVFRDFVQSEHSAKFMRDQLQIIYWRTGQRSLIEAFAKEIGLDLILKEKRRGGPIHLT